MSLDYLALIADLEAKRDALTQVIDQLRTIAGMPTVLPTSTRAREKSPKKMGGGKRDATAASEPP